MAPNGTPFSRHRPPHRLDAGEAVFITASTYRRYPHLRPAGRKDWFLELLRVKCREYHVELVAWVLLDEHYHLIAVPVEPRPELFRRWLGALHTISSREWNAQDECPGRQVWYQFWDRTLWTEGDLWSRINYVYGNPVKHGYVSAPEEYPWSSFHESEDYRAEPEPRAALWRFPAPRKLPNDDF
jgi:putative transposase